MFKRFLCRHKIILSTAFTTMLSFTALMNVNNPEQHLNDFHDYGSSKDVNSPRYYDQNEWHKTLDKENPPTNVWDSGRHEYHIEYAPDPINENW